MKKTVLNILCLFLVSSIIAQNGPVDFESGGNGDQWTWTVFENDSNPPLEIIDNPDPSGINTSATVAKFTALQTGQPFAGCETQHGADVGSFALTSQTSTITIMVWKSVISDVGIKLVEASSASLGEIKVANTLTDQWEEITFDFSSMEGITYDQIVVFPDFDARASDNIIYFDNISFGNLPPLPAPMVAAPDPTIDPANVISMFSNVYTDVPVDTWQTPWSSGSLSDIQIAGNDTKRYQSLDFVGIETVGSNLIDASTMEYFHMDIWTPNMTTFKIKLVDFGADENFEGGDDSEHELVFENPAQNEWISYEIPLGDFTGLNSRTDLAQLIISGLPSGGGTVYVDNVYFSTIPTSLIELNTSAKVELSPNPVQHNLRLSSDEIIEEFKIYSILGELILSKNAEEKTSSINVSSLTSGMYILVAKIDGGLVVEQFVKE